MAGLREPTTELSVSREAAMYIVVAMILSMLAATLLIAFVAKAADDTENRR
jgi:hypothetical protein